MLEIKAASDTRRYGGDHVKISDVPDIESSPQTPVGGYIARGDHIPSDTFDCIILALTLQYIYDMRSAIQMLYRILKPEGDLLATFPGITQIDQDYQWGKWYGTFTTQSARQLFEESFPAANIRAEACGKVLAAISLLLGLAVEKLRREERD